MFYMKRRDFAKIAGMGTMAMQTHPASASINLFKGRPTQSVKIPLGLCNHSLRSMSLNAQKLIEYAIAQKLDSILLNTFQPLDSLEPEYLSLV